MGIKFSGKKIVGIVISFIFVLGAIITIVKGWEVVLSILDFMKNVVLEILRFLTSTIGRDVLLFILVGILFWLFRREWKARNISQIKKSEEKEWEFDWDTRHDYILKRFFGSDEDIAIEALFEGYKENFPEDSEEEYEIIVYDIVYDLEESELIKHTATAGNNKFYGITKEGRRHYVKGRKRRQLEKFMGLRKK